MDRHIVSNNFRYFTVASHHKRDCSFEPCIGLSGVDRHFISPGTNPNSLNRYKSDTSGGLMLRQNPIVIKLLMFLMIAGLSGCFGGNSIVKLSASVEAASDVNPDPGGRPSPVVVRVYQLSSLDIFKSADFFAIYDSEISTLGQTFVGREEFEMQPGTKTEYLNDVDPSTKYIGVLAAFRDLDNARWRSFVQLPDEKKIYLKINLESLAVSVAASER